jgi:predicted 3-demethylubiquinone-9 3-methyltransferase (glyoxalase superfamily)
VALNGGPEYSFTEAVSFQIPCADQAEVDYYWDRLTADGGQPGPCGWLKDKFGVSWQVIPAVLGSLLSDPDPEKAARATQAMLSMGKLDIAALERAHAGA